MVGGLYFLGNRATRCGGLVFGVSLVLSVLLEEDVKIVSK